MKHKATATERHSPRERNRANGSNEIGAASRSLDEYFRRLDGEPPHGIYDMVIAHVERALLDVDPRPVERQPDARGGDARHEPQYAAREARQAQARSDRPQWRRSIAQALLSVSDKTGIVEFARGLVALGVALLSTGGTAKLLADAGIPVTDVGTYTGFPEMLDGRVKTLHPKIHGGILARRDCRRASRCARRGTASRRSTWSSSTSIRSAKRSREPGCTLDDAIENIDIGGPAMVRSGREELGARRRRRRSCGLRGRARRVAPQRQRAVGDATRFRLMQKAFAHTAAYDGAIANWLTARDARRRRARLSAIAVTEPASKLQDMRYGENPHQRAAFYREPIAAGGQPRGIPAAAGQGTVVQQHRRRRRRVGVRHDGSPSRRASSSSTPIRAASPVAATTLDAYRNAFATDPHVGVRRHHRVQPRRRRRDAARRSPRSSSRW